LPGLSGERVRAELFRLLIASDPAPVIRLMWEHDVLAHFLPEARRIDRLDRLVGIERDVGIEKPAPVRRLAALLEVDVAAAQDVADRLRLSNQERKRLVAIAAPPVVVNPKMATAERHRAAYRVGRDLLRDLALIGWAGAESDDGWRDFFAAVEAWEPPRFPLLGRDVIDLGVPRGPKVGKLLAAVEEWWVENDFKADREACLERLRQAVQD
jgi:poly(A) polymerase